MGGAVFPSLWLSSLSHPAYRLLGGARSWWKNGSLQEGSCLWVLPRTTAESIFVPTVSHNPHSTPHHLHRKPSDSSRQVWPRLLWGHCVLPWVLGHMSLVFSLQEWSFCLPQSCGIPTIKQSLQSQMLSGLFLPNARPPRLWSLTEDSEVSLLWENLCITIIFYFCESPTQAGMEFDLIAIVPCSPSCCGIYLLVFGARISVFRRFQCLVVVVQQLAVILVFSWDGVSMCPSTLLSCLYLLNVSLICLVIKDMS